MIELRHLKYFVAVARREHFRRAAEDLNVAQPAISSQIRQLETQLGVMLLERRHKRVRLTPAGTELLVRAERILRDLDEAEARMKEFSGLAQGRIAIGALPVFGELHFAPLIERFDKIFPGIDVSLREDSNERLLELLRAGEIDVGFLDTALIDKPSAELAMALLFTSPAVLIMARDHPLAGRATVRIAELRDERLIGFEHGSAQRGKQFEARCQAAGFVPHIAFRASQMSLVRRLASQGLGVAIGPSWIAEQPGAPVAVTEIDSPGFSFDVTLAWPARSQSPALLAFVSYAIEQLSGAGRSKRVGAGG